MSVHIGAKEHEIAERILLPGDPLRAMYIAETYLEGVTQYNQVRNMFGFTGKYKGVEVSVQGTGMGVPSISIYTHELINSYGVKKLIRVGTCGAYQEKVKVRDIILAMSASTDSGVNRLRFKGVEFAPTADFSLLLKAYETSRSKGLPVHVGGIFTSDTFYTEDQEPIELLKKHGVLAVEMETTALYTLAARFGVQALSILTVSDHLLTGEVTTAEERQTTFNQMIEIALDTIIAD
ncbi:purine-nucleoside phosphorylase [Thermicanus aegyptius]|uniref:purine-nucleoside phosphorylase n=1 Tax=Thermicanus aegyptius TaxID=94009 RepID=UPI0003FAA7E9|nr:purine-nucleoside phosphorylase [Thermicanus aegyptius]